MRLSVEGRQGRFDPHRAPEHPRERTARDRALEARESAAGISSATRFAQTAAELSVLCDEAHELGLRGLPAATDAGADRRAHAAGSASSRTGTTRSTGSSAGSAPSEGI